MATHALLFRHIPGDVAVAAQAPSRPPLLRRLCIAILVAQMRRARRQIGRKLGRAAPLIPTLSFIGPSSRRHNVNPNIQAGSTPGQQRTVPCSRSSSTCSTPSAAR
jgi:hypothetical protein